ncbi:MAG: hypothetical protein FWE18_00040 [Alphaproteobacteria bacterium]|nr:hypothetical protein [Alphaproteobacteria bacterium]
MENFKDIANKVLNESKELRQKPKEESINKGLEIRTDKLIIGAIKENLINPTVEVFLIFRGQGVIFNCLKSHAEAEISRVLEQYKDYDLEERRIIPKKIEYCCEKIKIKDALWKQGALDKEKLTIINLGIENLYNSLDNYGRPIDNIKKVYAKNLFVYPKKYITEALKKYHYESGKFPTIIQIENAIRGLNGIYSEFFWQINQTEDGDSSIGFNEFEEFNGEI